MYTCTCKPTFRRNKCKRVL